MRPSSVPALRRSLDIRRTDDAIVVLRGPHLDDLELDADDDRLWGLLCDIDGSTTAEALEQRHGPDVPEALALLEAHGVVDDAAATGALDAEVAERFSRQLAYFADTLSDWPAAIETQRRLGDRHVVVLGAGGLGGWTALALAASGIGALTIVDGDALELSNLNRQILFDRAHVGARKAALAEARLRAFRPDSSIRGIDRQVTGVQDVAELVAGADLAVCTLDQPAHVVDGWVHVACRAAGVPYLALSQHPPYGRVGPLYDPSVPGCYECQELAWRAAYPGFAAIHEGEQLSPPSATYGPACAVISAMAANEAMVHLAGIGQPAPSLAAELIVDLATWTVTRQPVLPRADCSWCGS